MNKPVAALLDGGQRLHLQHGPIDLIIGADPVGAGTRQSAFKAAAERFDTILEGLCRELPRHRTQLTWDTTMPQDVTAQRMYRAARPFCAATFVTPMSAVAGSVADEVLAAMLAACPLDRAYVNNGGDIAVHLAPGATFSVAMAGLEGGNLGRLRFGADAGIGGIATSGAGGRSLSRGIADSVSVLAGSAAQADVAATLIANAVDLPGHPNIMRQPAHDVQPDSDLGAQAVVTSVGTLSATDRAEALAAGRVVAQDMQRAGHIRGAALFLQGETTQTGDIFTRTDLQMEIEHA